MTVSYRIPYNTVFSRHEIANTLQAMADMTATPRLKGLLFLVLGGTGGTGKHFIKIVIDNGHRVRALVRNPSKIVPSPDVEVIQGSITDPIDTDTLVKDVDLVISMLGDTTAQATTKINTVFIKKLVPSMRRYGVKRFLYQAGGFSRPYGGSLSPVLWILRYTVASKFEGQHKDNDAVMEYLATEANDIDWIVHRAAMMGGNGPSKGKLVRSGTTYSIGTFVDCADYNYRMLLDETVVKSCDFSRYET